jgi:uncharacterized protein with FMN-binding domain
VKSSGITIAIIGAALLAFTAHSIWLGLGLLAVGAILVWRVKPELSVVVRIVALAVVAWAVGDWSRNPIVTPTRIVVGQAGQYQASSPDLLGLVKVRVVTRPAAQAPPLLIFAEAHSLPFLGIDQSTLKYEVARTLEHQGVPRDRDPRSEPLTAGLVRAALSVAISGKRPREEPIVPPGAWSNGKGADSYWGMFPDEYSHNCLFEKVPDGRHEGQSSNPHFPGRVALSVSGGKLERVEVVSIRASGHGQKAVSEIPRQMVEQQRIDVDVISGATRTSYILRSAAFNACFRAGGRPGAGR